MGIVLQLSQSVLSPRKLPWHESESLLVTRAVPCKHSHAGGHLPALCTDREGAEVLSVGAQTSHSGIAWKWVKNADYQPFLRPTDMDALERSPAICILTSPPGGSDIHTNLVQRVKETKEM